MTEPPAVPSSSPEPAPEPVCPRHPDRVAYVRCQRCGRPVCPECQRPAAVGVQCVDCVREQARTARVGTTVFGGRVTAGRPVVTLSLIGICVVVWLLELVSPAFESRIVFAPVLGQSQPWRFLTSAFAHDRTFVLHIVFNMYALFIVGSYLEPLLGRIRFAALYLISALGGSVVYLLMAHKPTPAELLAGEGGSWYTGLVGASGAVFGLFGALLVLNRRLGRSSAAMYATIAINAVLGFTIPGIAWQAHLGGFVTGVVCAAIIAYAGQPAPGRPARHDLHGIGLAAVTVVLVLLAVGKYAIT